MLSDQIQHKRWRHKDHGYLVTVLEILNYGATEVRCSVRVDRTRYCPRPRLWSGEAFLREFNPVGQPEKERTLWDML